MKIGLFVNPAAQNPIDVIIVYDYEKWHHFIAADKYGYTPILIREAGKSEALLFSDDSQLPIFHYNSWDELIQEEIMSGAPRFFLDGILQAAKDLRNHRIVHHFNEAIAI